MRLAVELFTAAGEPLQELRGGRRTSVVHGGPLYRPTVVDDAVIEQLADLSALAPLHNPPRR